MNEITINNPPQNNQLRIQVQAISDKIRKQVCILLIFWSIVIVTLTLIFYWTLDFPYPPIRNLIYSLLFAVVSVNWYISIPFYGVMIVIIARTKSRNYFFQLFPNLGLVIITTFVAFSNLIDFQEDSIDVIIYIVVMLIIHLRNHITSTTYYWSKGE